ncbi:MAG: HAMP domain-containing sensor histidine kinase, partial [Chloroherpetonaceae bacterium]
MSDGIEQQSAPIENDLDAAFAAFHEALTIAEAIDAKDLIAQLHRSLAEAYELKGDVAEAYAHFKKYHEVERQVFNEESDKKLKNLQVVHQVEQTKRDAELQKTKAEQLAELDKIKTRFFANLSHEFRTPLTLIIAPLQDQLDHPDKDVLRPKAEVMLRSASRLLTLINELLDLSKLEEGKLKLRVGEGDVVFFLNGIFQSFESLAEQKGLSMRFETNVSELVGFFDRDKLEKIFSNLCSNAFKFTKEGSVKVRLEVEGSAQKRLRVVIEDTGIGIPAEQQKNIFDRFYQVENSYARRYQGTGIGLALVKELVELHHGTIALESEEGKGTRFTIEFPIAKEAYTADEFAEALEEFKSEIPVAIEKKGVKKKASKPKVAKKAAT